MEPRGLSACMRFRYVPRSLAFHSEFMALSTRSSISLMLFTFWAMLKLALIENFLPILMKSRPLMLSSQPSLVILPALYHERDE